MSTTPVLEMEPQRRPFSVQQSLAAVARTHGKSYAAQLAEMMKLRAGEGTPSRREYFWLRLYDDTAYSLAEKRTFLGWRASQKLHRMVNNLRWECAATDKLIFYSLMNALGFPTPKAQAIYRRSADFPAMTTLPTPEALRNHLRSADLYPFFSKPVAEHRSVGVASVERFDRAADELVFASQRRVAVDDFAAAIEPFAEKGYLFQERLQPHDDVARICGERLPTIRIIVLLDGSRPEVFRAVWKIPVDDNIADNFWRKGNIIAAIDPESGRAWRAVTGVGPDLREIDVHPNTGASIKDISVPFWFEARDLCLAAATALPQTWKQDWDVAVTPRGPVLIEVNSGGDCIIPQLATGKGMLDSRFRRFLADCARQRGLKNAWKGPGVDGRG